MSRALVLFLSGALLAVVSVPGAWGFSPLTGDGLNMRPSQSLIVQVRKLSEKQKCKALNRCRQKYTWCYNKLVRAHKNIEKEKITCVKPYQKCINSSFSGLDFFFTRWFNPAYLDCKQYSG